MNNTLMNSEILSQQQTLKSCYQFNKGIVGKLINAVKTAKNPISNIVLAARGSSDNACTYFKYLCEIEVGLPVSFVSPSVVTLYDGKLDLSHSLVIGVSQSGKALDVLGVIERANEQGGISVGITNDTTSPIATNSQFSLFLNVGEEKSVAATKTFTAQMLTLSMIVEALKGSDLNDYSHKLDKLVDLIGSVIKLDDAISRLADNFVNVDSAFVLARGINLCAAQEIALKVQETCYLNARCFPISDFHHGPYALISDRSQVIMLCFDDVTEKDAEEMLIKLQRDNAKVTLFTNSMNLTKYATNYILLPSCDSMLAPFINVVCGQLFACNLSIKRGINPDSPRGLNKVTITK